MKENFYQNHTGKNLGEKLLNAKIKRDRKNQQKPVFLFKGNDTLFLRPICHLNILLIV